MTRRKTTKFSKKVTDQILEGIEQGYTKAMVSKKVGVPTDTITRWLRMGRMGQDQFRQFAIDYDASMGVAVQNMVDRVIEHAEKDWRAAAWLLERRYDQFKLKSRTSQKAQDALDQLAIKKAEAELEYTKAKTAEISVGRIGDGAIISALADDALGN